jgi:hypothetical protein
MLARCGGAFAALEAFFQLLHGGILEEKTLCYANRKIKTAWPLMHHNNVPR